ncbi:class I SAM-dependent methyltransferase [Candidatus Woesearchaeota archaeon]|nr:class I SAM-dependent methyltransferase [Candidatus Woesearchaeota archaeon]
MNHEQKFFDKIWQNVGKWENQGGSYRTKVPDKIVDEFIDFLKEINVKKGSVLDIGCGGGRHVLAFSKRSYQVTGIDYAPVAIALAEQLCKEQKVQAILQTADILKFKITQPFRIILDMGCLHHLRKQYWNRFRDQIYRLLSNEGYFCLVALSSECTGIRGYSKGNDKTYVLDNGHYTKFFSDKELLLLFEPYFNIEKMFKVNRGKSKVFWVVYMKKR